MASVDTQFMWALQARWREAGGAAALSGQQREAIQAVDALLEEMSGPDKAELLWTVEALTDRVECRDVRRRARAALERMGWPTDPPPGSRRAVFVSKPG